MTDLSQPMRRIVAVLKVLFILAGAFGLVLWLITLLREPSKAMTMYAWLWLGGSIAIGALGFFTPND